jgi:hypothetical protein
MYNNNMPDIRSEEIVGLAENQLPSDTAWLFPEYKFESMNLEDYSGVIIERILERGSWGQMRWLFETYGEALIADWVQKHGFRLLSKRSFALWRISLDIDDYSVPDWAITAKEMEPW